MNKIGISLARKYEKATLVEAIHMIKAAGFTALSPLWGTKVDMEEVCKTARGLGLYIQSLHAPFGKSDTLWSNDPAVYEKGLDLTMQALDDCIRLDIPIMVMHAWIDEDLSFDMDDLYFGNFDAIVEKATAHNVKIAFENTEGEEYLFALMDHYKDNPNVGYCWDSGHEMCYNHSQDLLAKFGDRLLMTHLNDNLGISDPGGEITWQDHLVHDTIKPLGRLPSKKPLADYSFGDVCWEYLDKMRLLCEENGAELILIKAPSVYPYWYDQYDAQIEEYATKHDLSFYNFLDNVEEIGIDYQVDTYDEGLHMDLSGATKLSTYFAKILSQQHGVPDHRGDAAFDELLKAYDEATK